MKASSKNTPELILNQKLNINVLIVLLIDLLVFIFCSTFIKDDILKMALFVVAGLISIIYIANSKEGIAVNTYNRNITKKLMPNLSKLLFGQIRIGKKK